MEKVPGHGQCPDLSGPGRPAQSMQIPAPSQIPPKLPFLATSYLEIAHWSILLKGIDGHGGDLDEMAVLLQGHAFCAWTAMDLAAISSLKSTH